MKKLNKKRLEYSLAIMEKNSIEYSIINNSYEIRLIPEIQQACKQIVALIKKEARTVTEEWIIEMAEETASDYPDVAFPNLITIFKGLLTEAGVEIRGK